MEPPSRSVHLRRLVLQGITVVILGWVSYGSHEVLTWIGVPWWPAWLYPAIVDLAVLYVTPFAVDPELSDDVRRHAKNTRKMILPVVTFFNIFHMILFVQQHRPSVPEPGLAVATAICAYVIAVITGCIPVAAYARVTSLETMDKANEVSRALEARRAEARRVDQKRIDDEAYEREQDTAQKAHDRRMDELKAEADAKDAARVAREAARESRGNHATPARATPAVNGGKPQVKRNIGRELQDRLQELWDAGEEPNPPDVARDLGADRTYGAKAVKALRERGIVPPSERPKLTLAHG